MEIVSIPEFLDYHAKLRARTLAVVRTIPPEHIEWTHRTGAFTFGDLIRHLGAMERYMFAENVRGNPSRYPGHGRELADGYDAVLAYLDRTHRESVEIFSALRPDDLRRSCTTPGGATMRVWKWLRAMTEHEIHHRGQVYLMLGILGVPAPPVFGLTSEEVRARSTP